MFKGQTLSVTVSLLLLTALFGCRRNELGRVSGQVTFDGQPQRDVAVILENRETGVFMLAPVDMDGRFEVSTADGYGLPLGTYEVAVQPYQLIQQTAGPDPFVSHEQNKDAPTWAPRWRDARSSGVRFAVAPGENQLNIELNDK